MKGAVARAAGALLTHQIYRRWPVVAHQQWVFYVCGAAFGVLQAWLLLQRAPVESGAPAAALWRFGCWLAIVECAQVALCGLAEFGNAVRCDLCIEAIGRDGYTALASAGAAAGLAWAWERRHGR